ncbi:MAG: rane-associated phospholipid phosphatase [Anaerocolumna sp.]|nr:rane-associated phospholipid phosphatase [Anaerocolumna sp.]
MVSILQNIDFNILEIINQYIHNPVLDKIMIGLTTLFEAIPTINLLIEKPLSYSFPSGHASSAFAAAGILLYKFKNLSIYIIILAGMMAFSRVYLLVHYPSDILVGIMIGLISSKIIITLFEYKKKSPSLI